MRLAFFTAGLAASCFVLTTEANAALTTYSFDAVNFVALDSPAATPYNEVVGSFQFDFDPAVTNVIVPIAFTSNLPQSYSPVSGFYDGFKIVIGNNCDYSSGATCAVIDGTDSFFFDVVTTPDGTPTSTGDFVYSSTTTPDSAFYTSDINGGALSSVPLPASAPMFGAALMALGVVGYGLKRSKAAAAA